MLSELAGMPCGKSRTAAVVRGEFFLTISQNTLRGFGNWQGWDHRHSSTHGAESKYAARF